MIELFFMSHAHLAHSDSVNTSHFLFRLKKNFILELKKAVSLFFLSFKMFIIGVIALFDFLSKFPLFVQGKGMILPKIIISFVGMYLTLLPTSIVIGLLFIPKKIAMPVLGLSVFFSFFKVFLI